MRLETTFGGAGFPAGDLTPECAAVVTAVLDALSVSRDAEDDRGHEQPPISSMLLLTAADRRMVAGPGPLMTR